MPANATSNTAAVAWAWLTRRLAELDAATGISMTEEWATFRETMDGRPPSVMSITDWPSDFWIAKTQAFEWGLPQAPWSIPEELDQWPTFGMPPAHLRAPHDVRRTNSAALQELLRRADASDASADGAAILDFHALVAAERAGDEPAVTSTNQVRAWLHTALSGQLTGIALTPSRDDETRDLLVRAVEQRIAAVESLEGREHTHTLMDYGCDALYNMDQTREGGLWRVKRQGQGSDWPDFWAHLSEDEDADAMRATMRRTGTLLVNEPLLLGLVRILEKGGEYDRRRVLCVTRRWLLTTKVLAWALEALDHEWTWIRPKDLACFAFAALSPTWPRRAVAVSHRSAEAKPTLGRLAMFDSPYAAVDATYVPAWETNTGMIWSLFAAVPCIARVLTPSYLQSEWCAREHELCDYLLDRSDFIKGRTVLDIGVDDLRQLDAALFDDAAAAVPRRQGDPFPSPQNEFPPLSLVLVGSVPSRVDLAILRAGAALRLIHALVRDPALANHIAVRLTDGQQPPLEAPTNNPDGWSAYGRVFRELDSSLLEMEAHADGIERPAQRSRPTPALFLPSEYSLADLNQDIALAQQIPDLSGGDPRLADVLAALEWQRTLFRWFNDEDYGDKVMVDLSELDRSEWVNHPLASVGRGLLAMRSVVPIWIVQNAGQDAHRWHGFHEHPIFTSYSDAQFPWLKPVRTDPSWLVKYLADSGLGIGPELEATMLHTVVTSDSPLAEKIRRQGVEEGQLTVPDPRDFFMIPTSRLTDLARFMDVPPEGLA